MQFANPRPSGIIAIALEEGDEVIGVRLTDGAQEVILSTARGQGDPLRARPTSARWAARLRRDAASSSTRATQVVGDRRREPGATLLAVTENGYGKRTAMDEYRLHPPRRQGHHHHEDHRANRPGRRRAHGDGRRRAHAGHQRRHGHPHCARTGSRVIGRNTQGVRLIELEEGERLASVARLAEREEEGEAREEEGEPDEPPVTEAPVDDEPEPDDA